MISPQDEEFGYDNAAVLLETHRPHMKYLKRNMTLLKKATNKQKKKSDPTSGSFLMAKRLAVCSKFVVKHLQHVHTQLINYHCIGPEHLL